MQSWCPELSFLEANGSDGCLGYVGRSPNHEENLIITFKRWLCVQIIFNERNRRAACWDDWYKYLEIHNYVLFKDIWYRYTHILQTSL